MTIKHKFESTVDDGVDDTLVRPSDWNDDHDGMNVHDHSDSDAGGELSSLMLMIQVFT